MAFYQQFSRFQSLFSLTAQMLIITVTDFQTFVNTKKVVKIDIKEESTIL